ncbi:polyisoprenoid-binding protein YceI [Brevibacterium pityocampae]
MTALPTNLTPGTWNFDALHSDFGFVARHAGVSKVRGEFTDFTGTITVADEFENSRVEASANVSSITTGNEQRDGHLQSGDFFLAEEHPQATFVSTAIENFDGAEFDLVGDLTMRGVTLPVTFKAEFNGVAVDGDSSLAGFSATTTVNRKDYGMKFHAAMGGGELLVSDKIVINIEIEAAKQA